jgi:hypothetical protein
MNIGNVLLIIGLIIVSVQFILGYEYPALANTGIGVIIAICGLAIIVLGALLLRKSKPSSSI